MKIKYGFNLLFFELINQSINFSEDIHFDFLAFSHLKPPVSPVLIMFVTSKISYILHYKRNKTVLGENHLA